MAGGDPTDEVTAPRPTETLARQTFDTLALGELARRIQSGDRAALARAITLVESSRPAHRQRAQELLQELLPHTGKAHRIGITGVPGVGKSTAIDQLGINLIAAGRRIAVLAVDPTSRRTGGSILGDKTRMQRLAVSDHAFIRPSPTSGTFGGVARRTRETMLLVEAAGYDVVIVETVGVGQSETAVAEMVDFFLVLLLAGGGDDLQGIKKGIIEIADMVVINKADGDNATRATRSAAEYQGALGLLTPVSPSWHPPVMTMSGRDNTGLDALWHKIEEHRRIMTATGEFAARRQTQAVTWMHDMLADRLMDEVRSRPRIMDRLGQLEAEVRLGRLTPAMAVETVMALLHDGRPDAAGQCGRCNHRRVTDRAMANGRSTVLLTGFGPFPSVPANATSLLVPRIAEAARTAFPGIAFEVRTLPTEWAAGLAHLDELYDAIAPSVALHFGVSSRARGFEVEARGVNRRAPSFPMLRALFRVRRHSTKAGSTTWRARSRSAPSLRDCAIAGCRPSYRATPAPISATPRSIRRSTRRGRTGATTASASSICRRRCWSRSAGRSSARTRAAR